MQGPIDGGVDDVGIAHELGGAVPSVEHAWSLIVRVHALAARRIEAELVRCHQLPTAAFEVLRALDRVPGRRLRMAEVAERVSLSRSGVSRVVDRLERHGLVHRQTCDDDLRGTYAALTRAGRERLLLASATYAAAVRANLGPTLGEEATESLVRLLGPLAAALGRVVADEPRGDRRRRRRTGPDPAGPV